MNGQCTYVLLYLYISKNNPPELPDSHKSRLNTNIRNIAPKTLMTKLNNHIQTKSNFTIYRWSVGVGQTTNHVLSVKINVSTIYTHESISRLIYYHQQQVSRVANQNARFIKFIYYCYLFEMVYQQIFSNLSQMTTQGMIVFKLFLEFTPVKSEFLKSARTLIVNVMVFVIVL